MSSRRNYENGKNVQTGFTTHKVDFMPHTRNARKLATSLFKPQLC